MYLPDDGVGHRDVAGLENEWAQGPASGIPSNGKAAHITSLNPGCMK